MQAGAAPALGGDDVHEPADLRHHGAEPARLQPVHGAFTVAVHRVAQPQHRVTGPPYRADQGGQGVDAGGAEPGDQGQPAR